MDLSKLVIAGLIVEAVWETTKLFWQNGKANYDRIGAVAVGELVAIGANMDFLAAVGLKMNIPYVGMILTGLLISRGANFMHDIMTSLNNVMTRNK